MRKKATLKRSNLNSRSYLRHNLDSYSLQMSRIFQRKEKKQQGTENLEPIEGPEVVSPSSRNVEPELSQECQPTASQTKSPKPPSDSNERSKAIELDNHANEMVQQLLLFTKEISEATELLSPLKSACSLLIRGLQGAQIAQDNLIAWKDLCEDLSLHLSELERYRDALDGEPVAADKDCLEAIEAYIRVIVEAIEKARYALQSKTSFLQNLQNAGMAQSGKEELEYERVRISNAWQVYRVAMNRVISHKVDKIAKNLLEFEDSQLVETSLRNVRDNYGFVGSGFSMAYGERIEVCEEGTRVDILAAIREWAVDRNTQQQIFWLNDAAGTGKSTICATLAKEWLTHGHLAGRFFFSPNSATTQTTKEFCRAVAEDIAVNQPMLATMIEDAVKVTPLDRRAWFDVQLRQLVIEPLQKLKSDGCVFLVVDALDNCIAMEERMELLEGLLRYLPSIRHLRIFLTSRPLQDIADALVGSPFIHGSDIQLLNVNSSYHHDINIYVEKRLTRVPTISSEHREMIISRSGGLFLFAATICRMLERGRHRSEVLKVLSGMNTTDKLERRMDILYLSALKQAQVDKEADKMMMGVLSLIIIAYQPLSINTLSKFLPDNVYVNDFVQDLGGVLKDGNPDRPIKVLHPTFREFLLSNEDRANGFLVNALSSSGAMAIACIDTLERILDEDMFQLDKSGSLAVRNSDIVDIDKVINTRTSPADRYASAFWAHHVAASDVTPGLWLKVLRFLTLRFLNWVELMSWRGSIETCIEGLSRLYARSRKEISNEENDLTSRRSLVIRYARQFVTRHQTLITDSALQTYSIALFFTPHRSPLLTSFRQRYSYRLPRIITSYVSEWGSWTTIGAHSAQIYQLLFSPNGSHLVSAAGDGLVQLWNGATGGRVGKPFQGKPDHRLKDTSECRFSADGTRLSFLREREELHVRFAQTGEPIIRPLQSHRLYALTPTMKQLFSVNGSSVNRRDIGRDASSSQHIGTLPEGFEAKKITLCPYSRCIVCLGHFKDASDVMNMFIWEVDPFKQIFTYQLSKLKSNPFYTSIDFSPDGFQFAIWQEYLSILYLYSFRTGRLAQVGEQWDHYNHVMFSAQSQHLACASRDSGNIIIRESETAKTVSTLPTDNRDEVICLSFSSDGKRLASVSKGRIFRIWAFLSGDLLQTKNIEYPARIDLVALSPGWDQLAIASADNQIHLFDLQEESENATSSVPGPENDTLGTVKLKKHPRYAILGASFVDSLVGIRDEITGIHLWDTSTGKTYARLSTPSYVSHLAFSPDGQMVATLCTTSVINIWNVQSLDVIEDWLDIFLGMDTDKGRLFFSSDSRLLGAHHSGHALLWDIQEREKVWFYADVREEEEWHFRLYALSSDNRKVAGVIRANQLMAWNLDLYPDRALTGSIDDYYDSIGSFSPTDSSLLAISMPRRLELWRVGEELQLIVKLTIPNYISNQLSFSFDGRYVAYGPFCWDIRISPSTPIRYSSDSRPPSFSKRGLNTHAFLSYQDGWIYSSFPPGPLLPIPTELRSIDLDKNWYISDERVIFLVRRGVPISIDCTLARNK
ncbi:hypothetical protein FRC19_002248 [Serendipita sp. 401]|nr:hypothetical protein FRC19_002248 [Serendipita sp. 401]KAG9057964.1 hypothetical protein FS842_002656 [Serendipita sp. 407]